jgi:FRG domain-containing protein
MINPTFTGSSWVDTKIVRDLASLRSAVSALANEIPESKRVRPVFIFRGQRSDWPLATTLERACKGPDGRLDDAQGLERRSIREFKRRAHQYVTHVPAQTHRIEWLSLMRHYGAPARLLDCTYTLEVATFFAVKEMSEPSKDDESQDGQRGHDAAVWALNCACRAIVIRQIGAS